MNILSIASIIMLVLNLINCYYYCYYYFREINNSTSEMNNLLEYFLCADLFPKTNSDKIMDSIQHEISRIRTSVDSSSMESIITEIKQFIEHVITTHRGLANDYVEIIRTKENIIRDAESNLKKAQATAMVIILCCMIYSAMISKLLNYYDIIDIAAIKSSLH
jgi:hypothetical protein